MEYRGREILFTRIFAEVYIYVLSLSLRKDIGDILVPYLIQVACFVISRANRTILFNIKKTL